MIQYDPYRDGYTSPMYSGESILSFVDVERKVVIFTPHSCSTVTVVFGNN